MNETAEKILENSAGVRDRTSPRKLAHIITFGCQMNRHDSQIVGGLLEKAGYGPADNPETAIVLGTGKTLDSIRILQNLNGFTMRR